LETAIRFYEEELSTTSILGVLVVILYLEW